MAASLLGTTGNWGIRQDETGILTTSLSFDSYCMGQSQNVKI